jgi:hypothetical protein
MEPEFEAYWLRFVRDHTRPGTQWAHLVGNLTTLAMLWYSLKNRRILGILTAPLPALLASWLSHKYIERNTPLNARENPNFFLRCEAKMAWHLATGTMRPEVERALATAPRAPSEYN